MRYRATASVLLPVVALAIASGAAWAVQTGLRLTMDGAVVSTNVRSIDGRAYVPLVDVAKALGRTVNASGGAYDLALAASAQRRDGLNGKMATDGFSGLWRLNVRSVEQVAGYSPQYGSDKAPITPRESGDALVVIKCQLRNGTKAMQDVSFDRNASGNTAVVDDQEHGYVPLAYDARNSGYGSAKIPPATTMDFAILFSVPAGAKLTHLTYSVGGAGMDKSTDFQVSLTE